MTAKSNAERLAEIREAIEYLREMKLPAYRTEWLLAQYDELARLAKRFLDDQGITAHNHLKEGPCPACDVRRHLQENAHER